jgi:hypothetical protein
MPKLTIAWGEQIYDEQARSSAMIEELTWWSICSFCRNQAVGLLGFGTED